LKVASSVRWGAGSIIGCAALLTVGMTVSARSQPEQGGAARANVSLAGVPVAGKPREEVERLAKGLADRLLAYPVAFRYQKRVERTTPRRLGAAVDTAAAVNAVFAPPPAEGLIQQIRTRLSGPEPVDVPLPLAVSEDAVKKALMRFSIRIGTDPRDARFTTVKGKRTAIPPKPGKELDFAAAAQAVQVALDAADLRSRAAASLSSEQDVSAWVKEQAPVELKVSLREAQPRITLEMLEPISATLATFSTGLGASSRNRVHNVRLACKAIDGAVLLPGDVFSYNETVGPRLPSAGFREAPVIVRGELQQGTGGGICQVSSTLYNAALLSDMQILRRSHHAFPVHYVAAGRDATVVDGSIDFRFKNRLDHPVAIDAKVVGRRVAIAVFGHPDDKRSVDLVRSGISGIPAGMNTKSDARLPRGRRIVEKRAKSGRRVTLTRIVKKDGEVVRREVVSRDYYRPFSGVIRIGTAQIRKPSAASKPAPSPAGPALSPDPAPPVPVESSAR